MEFNRTIWNDNQKLLKNLMKKEESFQNAINLFLDQHAMVHDSCISKKDWITFEDKLWQGMDDSTFRLAQNKKGRTVAYGIWHSTRIEDITMNLLVANEIQIIDQDNWIEKLHSIIYDTGNTLCPESILKFSKTINRQALKEYRKSVALKTRLIVNSLNYQDLNKRIPEERLQKVSSLSAVLSEEQSFWLIDFWRKKTVSGILLMPVTRHHLVHLNESMQSKAIGQRK